MWSRKNVRRNQISRKSANGMNHTCLCRSSLSLISLWKCPCSVLHDNVSLIDALIIIIIILGLLIILVFLCRWHSVGDWRSSHTHRESNISDTARSYWSNHSSDDCRRLSYSRWADPTQASRQWQTAPGSRPLR